MVSKTQTNKQLPRLTKVLDDRKKMNFTTDLPKKRPEVTYIVASSVRCMKQSEKNSQSHRKESDVFRMHAVVLYKPRPSSEANPPTNTMITPPPQTSSSGGYILCHIRKIDVFEAIDKSLLNKGTSAAAAATNSSDDSENLRPPNARKKFKASSDEEEEDYEEEEEEEEEEGIEVEGD